MPYKDPEKQRESDRKYRQSEHGKQHKKEYDAAHREDLNRNKRQFMKRNPGYGREEDHMRKRDTVKWMQEYKSSKGCAFCGETHPACLTFHHREPRNGEKPVSRLAAEGYSRKRIQEEMDKCVVICENCHRKLHWNEGHPQDDLQEVGR